MFDIQNLSFGDTMVTDFSFLRELAAAASAETLPRFRQPHPVTNKEVSGFDPVTEADREAERAIRRLITERFPGHGIIGEEFGAHNPSSTYIWVIDPIDGTRAFISGLPVWGTLIGLLVEGKAEAGLMAQPFTGELFMAAGGEAIYEGPGGNRKLKTRNVENLSEAVMFTTTPQLFRDAEREIYDRLEANVKLARYGCDCYAFAMLAAGHVDLVVESGLQVYDIAGLVSLIQNAGGTVMRWDGGPAETGGTIIAAATEKLCDEARRHIGQG